MNAQQRKLIEMLSNSQDKDLIGEDLEQEFNMSKGQILNLVKSLGKREFDDDEGCGTPGCRWRKSKNKNRNYHYYACRVGDRNRGIDNFVLPLRDRVLVEDNRGNSIYYLSKKL